VRRYGAADTTFVSVLRRVQLQPNVLTQRVRAGALSGVCLPALIAATMAAASRAEPSAKD
jgi:hypothetical protein